LHVSAPASDPALATLPVDKKRKLQHVHDGSFNALGEQGHRLAREEYLKEQGLRLKVQAKLDEKEMALHEMRNKQACRDKKQADELDVMKTQYRNDIQRYRQETFTAEIENRKLRTRLTQRDITINQLECENNDLRMELCNLKAINRNGHSQAPVTSSRGGPTCVPDKDPEVHSHKHYPHDQAPRENRMFGGFQASEHYAPGTGKIWPRKYGSGANWDLGLCRIAFDTDKTCIDSRCEFRHHLLTANERKYIQLLTPFGPNFLRHIDSCTYAKVMQSI